MKIKMYDLAGAMDDHRFSPYCWRIRMALAHKRLNVETVPWRFTEKEAIAFTGQGRVPVLVDDHVWVADSWRIANYLEDTYPHLPSLFGGSVSRGEFLFVKHWVEQVLHPLLARLVLVDIPRHLQEKDRRYFIQSREKHYGMSLEALCADRAQGLGKLNEALASLRCILGEQPYVGGESPSYADYIVLGAFQWVRCVSELRILKPDDPVCEWRDRLFALYDGLAAKALCFGP
jgi:glutathione S-transferase